MSSEYELLAPQISDWKKQVISGISSLFGVKKAPISDDQQDEITSPLYQQIGHLKVENDFLKKVAEELLGVPAAKRKEWIEGNNKLLSIEKQCELLSLSRSSYYLCLTVKVVKI